MGYYIFQRPDTPSREERADSPTEAAGLRTTLETGSVSERRQAVLRLVALRAEDVLAGCLSSEQALVVQLASAGLWECWLGEAGSDARQRMEGGVDRMNEGDLEEAGQVFTQLMEDYPDWAEAANKKATVLYLQGRPQASIELCRRVVALKPDHFGAWNGMALCAIQGEDWPLALQAVHESLRLQPRSQANQQLLRLVQTRLPQA